jgi:2-keto-3-deoxy-L-rhamnonate aldolase RhmA
VSSEGTAVNRIWQAHREGRVAFGMSIKAPSRRIIASAGRAGLDFVRFDLAAESVPPAMLGALVATALDHGLTPLVRVERPDQLAEVFAAGALGVTVPHIGTAGEAQEIVALSRDAAAELAGDIIVSIQIETASALEAVEEIAGVAGIHMLQSGRNDLAAALKVPGQPGHELVLAAEDRIAAAALQAGKLLSLHFAPGPTSIGQAKAWIARGLPCLTIGADTQILDDAVSARLEAIRGDKEPETAPFPTTIAQPAPELTGVQS